ncbi:hypothetical protein A7K94_0221010 [Modestobacter sp. VKM Ac-2676]|nr:hypothetical protein A7K94_0221010 [Modestobacter sp. VKM Ac-2676]
MHIRRLATAGATAGLAAVLLAGCGGDSGSTEESSGESSPSAAETSSEPGLADQTGAEVSAAAADALEEAGSVHVVGSTGVGAEVSSIDLLMQGDDVSGSVEVGGQALGLLRTGGVFYMQAPADYWTASGVPAELAAELDGAWVVLPEEAAASFAELSLATLVEELRAPTAGVEDEVTTDEFEGEPVVVVTRTDDSTLAVAAEGEPYPLQVVSTGDQSETLTFSEHGEQFDIAAPEAPIDPSQLGAGG